MAITKTITHNGDTWTILGTGIERDGKSFCHLASTTRTRVQHNGVVPVQICDWVPLDTVNAIKDADRIEAMCTAHHQVRTVQGFTTSPWEKLEERNREQYREAMRAALWASKVVD